METDLVSKIRGIVIPASWDQIGRVTSIAIATFDEDEFIVAGRDKGQELIDYLRIEVEISGKITEENGKKIIKVKGYEVRARSKITQHF